MLATVARLFLLSSDNSSDFQTKNNRRPQRNRRPPSWLPPCRTCKCPGSLETTHLCCCFMLFPRRIWITGRFQKPAGAAAVYLVQRVYFYLFFFFYWSQIGFTFPGGHLKHETCNDLVRLTQTISHQGINICDTLRIYRVIFFLNH